MTSMCDPDSQPCSSDSLRRSPSAFQQAICRRLRVFRFARYRRFFALLVRPRELPTAAPPAPPPPALATGGAVSLIQRRPGRCGRPPDGLSSRGSGPLNVHQMARCVDGGVSTTRRRRGGTSATGVRPREGGLGSVSCPRPLSTTGA